MNRKEIDEAILNAIELLKQQSKPVTAANIQDVSGANLRLYQIYNSKHKSMLDLRSKNPKNTQISDTTSQIDTPQVAEPAPVVASKSLTNNAGQFPVIAPSKSNAIDINLQYQLGKTIVAIVRNNASSEDIDEAIEDLNFIFTKSIQRLEREKAKLTK